MIIQCQGINAILQKKDPSIISANNLTQDFFSDYKDEYNYIVDHIARYGNVPDQATFLSAFPNFDVIEVNESTDYIVDQLYEDRNKRQLAKTFNSVRDLLTADKVDEAMRLFTSAAGQVTQSRKIKSTDIFRDTSRYDAYVERINDFSKYYVKTGFPELDEIIGGWDRQEELVTIAARPGVGKCLEKGTEVMMADGSLRKIEDVQVGDYVQSIEGANKVLALHSGISKGYRIVPKRGDPFVVSENHILTLAKLCTYWDTARKMATTSGKFELEDMTVEKFLSLSQSQRRFYRLYKPAINYECQDLSIPPYILGIWLGDGTSCRAEITTKDTEILEEWRHYAQSMGMQVRQDLSSKSVAHSYEITKGRKDNSPNLAIESLRELGVLNNKHIPRRYLHSSKQQRLDLLAGILDTDGYNAGNSYTIGLSNYTLIKDIRQLATGLGFRVGRISTRYNKRYSKTFYTISIQGSLWEVPVRLPHKKIKYSEGCARRKYNMTTFKIEEVPEIEYFGFMCDGDHRFLLADGTVTHNSWVALKVAIAAAQQGLNVGLYAGEMSERKVGYRADTLISHISNSKITRGDGDIQVEYKKFLDHVADSIPGSLKVITPQSIGGLATVSTLRAFIEQDHLDMLCIDQHSLLEDERKGRSPVEKAANISRDLKALQVLKKIPIIAVSQQNRESTEEVGVSTANIAQSDRIGQDSTIVIFLSQKDDVFTLSLTKARDATSGKELKYAIDLNRGIFTYIPVDSGDSSSKDDCDTLRAQFESDEYISNSSGEDIPW